MIGRRAKEAQLSGYTAKRNVLPLPMMSNDTMPHPLDNPAWNALTTGNASLAQGIDEVKFFDREVSPFVGFAGCKPTQAQFDALYEIAPERRAYLSCTPFEMEIPAPWTQLYYIGGLQMVYEGDFPEQASTENIVRLDESHIPQMVALAKLTNPGPFENRTIDFGRYYGIFERDKLVAMTGERMHPANYIEISAVCTHPDHLGKGYARQLMLNQISLILNDGQVPFLHVRRDNDRAIGVYESLGFKKRTEVHFYVFAKNAR